MAQKGAFLGYNALLGDGSYVENRPSKWQRTLGILNEYNPIDAFWRLAQSPMASGGAINDQNIADGMTVAGTASAGTVGWPRSVQKNMASKAHLLYDPPSIQQREIAMDYPKGVPVDEQGRITHDIEGRPLTARWVAGWRDAAPGRARGNAETPSPAEFDAIAEATTGQGIARVPSRLIGQDAGRTYINRITGKPESIAVFASLKPEMAVRVDRHELGHAIDAHAGNIPVNGLMDELKGLYNTLNNPNRNRDGSAASWGKPVSPETHGYSKAERPAEYMVEAIRAYMTNPGYVKEIAPKTAARIRAYVNAHPELSKIIQFNTLAGVGLMGAQNAFEGEKQ